MASQREKSKKLLGFYATPEEKKALQDIAKARGISVAELLRRIANGTMTVGLLALSLCHLMRSPSDWSPAALAATGHTGLAFIASLL
jgi:hypothetical protein